MGDKAQSHDYEFQALPFAESGEASQDPGYSTEGIWQDPSPFLDDYLDWDPPGQGDKLSNEPNPFSSSNLYSAIDQPGVAVELSLSPGLQEHNRSLIASALTGENLPQNYFTPSSEAHLCSPEGVSQPITNPLVPHVLSSNSNLPSGHNSRSSLNPLDINHQVRTQISSDTSSRRQSTQSSARDTNSLSPLTNSRSFVKGEGSPASSYSTYPGERLSSSPGSTGSPNHYHTFPANPSVGLKRKKSEATDDQKRKKTKVRKQGACVGCRLRRQGCASDREGSPCQACIKAEQRFPRCIATKPTLVDKNIFLDDLPLPLKQRVLSLAIRPMKMNKVIRELCGKLVQFDPALQELEYHKRPNVDHCRPVRQQSCLKPVAHGWFGKLYLSNLLVSARAILQGSTHFNYNKEDADNAVAIRAISAVKTFKFLNSAIEKNALEKMVDSCRIRGRNLIVFLAITLEQAQSFQPDQGQKQDDSISRGNIHGLPPCSAVAPSYTASLEETRTDLIYHLAYYLRFLVEKVFSKYGTKIADSIQITQQSAALDDSFWDEFMDASKALDETEGRIKSREDSMRQTTAVLADVKGNEPEISNLWAVPALVIRHPTLDVNQGHETFTKVSDEVEEQHHEQDEDARSISSYRSASRELTREEIESICVKSEDDSYRALHLPMSLRSDEIQQGEVTEHISRFSIKGLGKKAARGVKKLFTG